MGFSKFLLDAKQNCKKLVAELSKSFKYVSVLGADVKGIQIMATKNQSVIADNSFDKQQGFVVKMSNGKAFFEYSFDTFDKSIEELASIILSSVKISSDLENIQVDTLDVDDEVLVKDFLRESDLDNYDKAYLLDYCKKNTKKILKMDKHIVNVNSVIVTQDVSKLFVSKNKELTQNYTWVNATARATYIGDNGKMSTGSVGSYSNKMAEALKELPKKFNDLVYKCERLSKAKPITPGVYDVITDPSITGLIAHEAFGHGVEMDQFVKDRALAKKMVGEYVASPIVNMKDGASSVFSTASYFFDDDGVLAHDTQIIKDGKLVTGICDLVSSRQLNCEPTGNGRRQSYKRKAYTRMTNTFFCKGNDNLDDMIASIKHGYMLFETNNGMEDPKNWAIQCVCQYGIEIVDGKLTDNYVTPVVMSGFVPDVLKSISMISNDFREIGSGSCGKGYKEWVRVSDGGAHLKAKVKLS